jgi:hypothetical protein
LISGLRFIVWWSDEQSSALGHGGDQRGVLGCVAVVDVTPEEIAAKLHSDLKDCVTWRAVSEGGYAGMSRAESITDEHAQLALLTKAIREAEQRGEARTAALAAKMIAEVR